MRKLKKENESKATSLIEITRACRCTVVCGGGYSWQSQFELQEQYAHTGTMPQGIDIDF